jgi:hypothetical protein
MPLPFGGNEFSWNERDPTKIQACHWDYEGSVYRPDEHSAGVLDTRLVMRPSYYFGIGTVDSTVPGVPSVEEISEAVSPRQTRFDPNTMWNRLMEQYKIHVFCRNPTWDMIQQIDRMDEM